ncbi:cation:proton antiporter [Prolixibacter sp. SD074]|uniref:cation:proton antiporter n=1 Tax=Prolixibacter sp. SD074 TaxID=2652391 RepID=UPI0012705AFF|nr:cation:proton antiporter [Prolixibacter sp. SD074]GET28518.1 potassium transporter [Prolixibacter sp. SD074]
MDTLLITGIILLSGYVFGQVFHRIGLPRVTGYIVAGIMLNPRIFFIVPDVFLQQVRPITDLCLAFITMEVGTSLTMPKLRQLGRSIIAIAFAESIMAFLLVGTVLYLFLYLTGFDMGAAYLLPFSMLVASLAAPTDPTATLAVMHEYKARGRVTDTIMGVAALDDAICIIIFSVAINMASSMLGDASAGFGTGLLTSLKEIIFSVGVGILFGWIFNFLARHLKVVSEGAYIILIIGGLAFCFGIARTLEFDGLLSAMSLGLMIANFNPHRHIIKKVMQRYTEELIFLFFFTVSGMYLEFSVVSGALSLILLFVLTRGVGKFTGVYFASRLTHQSVNVRRFTIGGLIPQGGIVIGLALAVHATPEFEPFAKILLGTIMGATIIHEIIGPLISRFSLRKAGETEPVVET